MQRGSRNSDGADKEGMGNGSESGKEGGKEAVELGTGASEGGRERGGGAALRGMGKSNIDRTLPLSSASSRCLSVSLAVCLALWL